MLQAQAERIAVIRKVAPAVVAVCRQGGQGVGSGVLISPEGYALTNFHVVQPTGPILQAGLPDGVLYDAVVVGIDRVGDVALIKLLPKQEGKPFPYVPMGDSDKVRIGDWSLAMGNPFSLALDFTPTVTYGIVSGTNRYQPPEGRGLLEYTDCIQIETSINPGNSGGPLFNMQGELIGINGRGSFEKRGRVNSGVGYAISINQIKNFLGHLHAGLDVDHATLGAIVQTAGDDAPLSQMVIGQILEESDAYRRGLRPGDQLVSFAGRVITSTNQYKNILGIFPKEWRVPIVVRRNNERMEMLVRLMGSLPQSKEGGQVKQPESGKPPVPVPVPAKEPKSMPASPAAQFYKPKAGYANWYFNELERDKLLTAFRQHGDFAALAGNWTLQGTYQRGEQKGPFRCDLLVQGEEPLVKMVLNASYELAPLKTSDPALLREPIGSGGLMLALYHYQRLLTIGPKGFEGECSHAGHEPCYPFPLDGSVPASLAELRVDCAVLRTKHGATECKWYFNRKDNRLLAFEVYVTRDQDPCEVYCHDYKAVDGRWLPHRLEVRHGDRRYAVISIEQYQFHKDKP
ncbi:MAG: trypsin-like peptidase domain-containing protein [Gemmataceae bacterium]|nr:trypsin-like peptidase domain-containing protein [Gemmataceae bacterium]MDW8242523.1 trypsin-like peptidase domain-containing protein [Thermogemmata sp.]